MTVELLQMSNFVCLSFQTGPIMKAARSNMLGAGTSNNKVKYSRLSADDDGYIDLQVRHLFFVFGHSSTPYMIFNVFLCRPINC